MPKRGEDKNSGWCGIAAGRVKNSHGVGGFENDWYFGPSKLLCAMLQNRIASHFTPLWATISGIESKADSADPFLTHVSRKCSCKTYSGGWSMFDCKISKRRELSIYIDCRRGDGVVLSTLDLAWGNRWFAGSRLVSAPRRPISFDKKLYPMLFPWKFT